MHGMSWQNLMMLTATIPSLNTDKDGKPVKTISFFEMGKTLMSGKKI